MPFFMLIKQLKRHQIDDVAWDNCVNNALFPLIYAQSWYLDVVSPNWQGFVLCENDMYLAVMPLPIKQKWQISYVEQPIYCQQLGIFCAEKNHTDELYTAFLDLLEKKFKLVANYAFHSQSLRAPLEKFAPKMHFTHLLDLSNQYEKIHKYFRKDRKYQLKKHTNLHIKVENDIAKMLKMFDESAAKTIEGGIHQQAYTIFEKLYRCLILHTDAQTLYTYSHEAGELDSGAFFVKFQNRIYYLYNAAFSFRKKYNGRTLLINKIIQENAERAIIFDFESAQKESVADYYASFGAKPTPFLVVSWDQTNRFVKFIRLLRRKFIK